MVEWRLTLVIVEYKENQHFYTGWIEERLYIRDVAIERFGSICLFQTSHRIENAVVQCSGQRTKTTRYEHRERFTHELHRATWRATGTMSYLSNQTFTRRIENKNISPSHKGSLACVFTCPKTSRLTFALVMDDYNISITLSGRKSVDNILHRISKYHNTQYIFQAITRKKKFSFLSKN